MKSFGVLVTIAGVIYLIIAFNMDVSVSTVGTYVPGYGQIGGGDVANLDLMARRQNHVIIAGLLTLVGVLLMIFGKDGSEAQSVDASGPKPPPHFTGRRDLTQDPYRLWLAETYGIKRSDVFNRFVVGQQTFETLDDALAFAHSEELEIYRIRLEREEAERLVDERKAKEDRMILLLGVGTIVVGAIAIFAFN
ncbi:hypothetical protein ACWPMX_03630 [Tsuneonella sp. HG094]